MRAAFRPERASALFFSAVGLEVADDEIPDCRDAQQDAWDGDSNCHPRAAHAFALQRDRFRDLVPRLFELRARDLEMLALALEHRALIVADLAQHAERVVALSHGR